MSGTRFLLCPPRSTRCRDLLTSESVFSLREPGRRNVRSIPARRSRGPLSGRDYAGGMSRLDRITSDPTICHGQPTVRRLRYTVESLLELLASGMTIDDILEDHPDLERDDLLAVLEFGALAAGQRRVVPLGAA